MLLDLPLHFMDFEGDDPALYSAQVRWVLDTEGIEAQAEAVLGEPLTFSAEAAAGGAPAELRAGGLCERVTDANKHSYLMLLARHRLGGRAGQRPPGLAGRQVEAFVAGFSAVLGIEALEIFDERELELLCCGTPAVDARELRAHAVLDGWRPGDEVRGWLQPFWSTVYFHRRLLVPALPH